SGDARYLDLDVVPLVDASRKTLGVQITFMDVSRYRRLQEELARSKHDLETAYEELQSTNEELETTNEELQSTNEELETMNEELQSTNEELETTNTELRMRSDELNTANAFLASILTGLEVAVIVVDPKLQVLAWNHRAEDLWGSRPGEVLRSSVERLCQLAAAEDLEKLGVERRKLEQALASLTVEADVLRAERDAARGETRRIELQLTAARQILDDGPDGFIVTDRAGVILQANRAATHLLGVSSRFLVRKPLSLFIDEADLRMFRWRVNNAHVWSHGEWPVRIRPRNGAPLIP